MDIIAGHWQWIINFEEKMRSFNYCNLKNCLLDGPGAGQHIIRTKAMLGFPIFPFKIWTSGISKHELVEVFKLTSVISYSAVISQIVGVNI